MEHVSNKNKNKNLTIADSNIALILDSDSPLTPEIISVDWTSMKASPNSPAIAWAKLVFPLPVGPKIKMPLKINNAIS